MPETKTEQKNWRFTPQILSELDEIRQIEMRSEQNMVEVLIHREYERVQRLKRVISTETREEICNG